jgi:hypothetical protein
MIYGVEARMRVSAAPVARTREPAQGGAGAGFGMNFGKA